MADAELVGGAGGRRSTIGGEAFDGADRGEHDGQAQLSTEPASTDVDSGHVAQHPRSKAEGIERQAVAAERRLGLRASDQIVPGVGGEVRLRRPHQLVEGEEPLVEARGYDLAVSTVSRGSRLVRDLNFGHG